MAAATPRRPKSRVSYILGREVETPKHRLGVNALAYDPVRDLLYSGSRDSTIRSWTVPDGAAGLVFDSHTDWVNDISIVNDGRTSTSALCVGHLANRL